eukprot:scaffold996_cov271-Chaetoceros_neogracile.AAC.7
MGSNQGQILPYNVVEDWRKEDGRIAQQMNRASMMMKMMMGDMKRNSKDLFRMLTGRGMAHPDDE